MYQREPGGKWYISVGGTRRSSGTTDKKKAQALEHRLNAEAWDRQHGFVTPTWEQACVGWIENNPGPAAKDLNKRFLEFWRGHLVGKQLQAITPKLVHAIVVQHFKADPEKPIPANSTANYYVSFLRRVIRSASNLNPQLISYPKPRGRDRWLTPVEWNTLAGAMDPDYRDLCLFALATGLREANDMFFRWAWLHDNDTWALIPGDFTKTGKDYGIPLNRTAQAVIKRRRAAPVRHPELVFLNRLGKPWYRVSVCGKFREAVAASGIPVVTFHGLRHTFASWLAQRGVSDEIKARLGCWSTGSVPSRYSHFDVESLRSFSELIDEILANTVSSRQKTSA